MNLKVVMFIVSEKWRTNSPMFMSRSKLSRIGALLSVISKSVINGSLIKIGTTGFGMLCDVWGVESEMK